MKDPVFPKIVILPTERSFCLKNSMDNFLAFFPASLSWKPVVPRKLKWKLQSKFQASEKFCCFAFEYNMYHKQDCRSWVSAGGGGRTAPSPVSAVQLTLSQPGRADYAHHLHTTCPSIPPGFSDPPLWIKTSAYYWHFAACIRPSLYIC